MPPQDPEHRIDEDRFPREEDWEEVQGGKPTLWIHPARMNNVKVVHAYGDEVLEVDTPLNNRSIPKHMRTEVAIQLSDGRTVQFPALTLKSMHGDPCKERSSALFSQKGAASEQRSASYDAISLDEILMSNGYRQLLLGRNDKPGVFLFKISPRST